MESDRGRVVTVAVCRRPGLAQLAQSILESAGIESFIQGEHASGLYSGAMSSRVMVSERDADEATKLLSAEEIEIETAIDVDDSPIVPGNQTSWSGLVYVLLLLFAIGAVVIVISTG